jgi:serine/threonine protein kinase
MFVVALKSEYYDGGTLEKRIGEIRQPQKHIIAFGIARGIGFLHRRGIAHGNLDPANVLLNERMEPVIIGFGLCGSERSRIGGIENIEDDILAFGRLLWWLVNGKAPEDTERIPRGPYANLIQQCLNEDATTRINARNIGNLLKYHQFKREVGETNIMTFKTYVESFGEELDKERWKC